MKIKISQPLAEELAQSVSGGLRHSPRTQYLLPFVCAKLFASVVLTKQSGEAVRHATEVTPEIEETIVKTLNSRETFADLERKHHAIKLIDDKICQLTVENPIVLFMQDIIAYVYETELTSFKIPEYMVQQQINTNWLALYLFGRERYFVDLTVCSLYSDMTLPVLLPLLFSDRDEDTEGEISLSFKWLYDQTNAENVKFRRDKEIEDLHEMSWMCLDEIENCVVEDPYAWRKKLSHWIYQDELWQDSGLVDSDPQYSGAVRQLNQLNRDVGQFLSRKHISKSKSVSIVRLSCLEWIVEDATDTLTELFNQLCTL